MTSLQSLALPRVTDTRTFNALLMSPPNSLARAQLSSLHPSLRTHIRGLLQSTLSLPLAALVETSFSFTLPRRWSTAREPIERGRTGGLEQERSEALLGLVSLLF